jgi:hypothetical protein
MPLRQSLFVNLLAGCALTLLVVTNVWAERTARAILESLPRQEQPALALVR